MVVYGPGRCRFGASEGSHGARLGISETAGLDGRAEARGGMQARGQIDGGFQESVAVLGVSMIGHSIWGSVLGPLIYGSLRMAITTV